VTSEDGDIGSRNSISVGSRSSRSVLGDGVDDSFLALLSSEASSVGSERLADGAVSGVESDFTSALSRERWIDDDVSGGRQEGSAGVSDGQSSDVLASREDWDISD